MKERNLLFLVLHVLLFAHVLATRGLEKTAATFEGKGHNLGLKEQTNKRNKKKREETKDIGHDNRELSKDSKNVALI